MERGLQKVHVVLGSLSVRALKGEGAKFCSRGLWMAPYVHITLLHIYIGPSFESVAQLSCQVVGKLFGCTFPPFLPTYICSIEGVE